MLSFRMLGGISLVAAMGYSIAAAEPVASPPPPLVSAIGPHDCAGFYPAAAAADAAGGNVHVSYQITEQGTVENPSVVQSSANPLLDQAALDCVKTWLYSPAKKDGKPISVGWEAMITFKAPDPTPRLDPKFPHTCIKYFPYSRGIHVTGISILTYDITIEGTVINAKVVTSSGDPKLDDAALACASGWKYLPALKEGVPVQISWRAAVSWNQF